MKKNPLPKAEDESDRKLLADIARVGWHLIGIPGDEDGPSYVFSVGLYHTFDQPEILILGLDFQIGSHLINDIGDLMKSGTRVANRDVVDGIADGFPLGFRTVTHEYYRPYIGYALWFYESFDFPVLQCLWPDRESRFPWDLDCDDSCRRIQRLSHDDE